MTFPGAYHSGYSTGLNIGEAVNFVSKSWFDHGLKCQEIYRKTREKIPVFPMDWLVIENIKNINSISLDLETKIKLRDVFSRIWKDEKKQRDVIEKSIKQQMIESGDRSHAVFEIIGDRENVAEDAN